MKTDTTIQSNTMSLLTEENNNLKLGCCHVAILWKPRHYFALCAHIVFQLDTIYRKYGVQPLFLFCFLQLKRSFEVMFLENIEWLMPLNKKNWRFTKSVNTCPIRCLLKYCVWHINWNWWHFSSKSKCFLQKIYPI